MQSCNWLPPSVTTGRTGVKGVELERRLADDTLPRKDKRHWEENAMHRPLKLSLFAAAALIAAPGLAGAQQSLIVAMPTTPPRIVASTLCLPFTSEAPASGWLTANIVMRAQWTSGT